MIARCLFGCVLLLPQLLCGQNNTWTTLSYPQAGCAWQMPSAPSYLDSLGVRMYSLELDTAVGITVHFVLDMAPDITADGPFMAAFDVEGDTLRAMAQLMLLTSGAELVAISDTLLGAVAVLDMVTSTPLDLDGNATISRLRLVYDHKRFMSFLVLGPSTRSSEIQSYAAGMNSSLNITTW